MRPRWYVTIIAIGSILNAALFGWLWRRGSRRSSRRRRSLRKPPAVAPQPDRSPPPAKPVVPMQFTAPQPAPTPEPRPAEKRSVTAPHWLPRLAIGIVLIAAGVTAFYAQNLFSQTSGPLEKRDAGIPYALAAMVLFSLAAWLADHELGRAVDPSDCATAPHKINTTIGTRFSPVATIRRHPWRAVGLLIAIGLEISVLAQLRGGQFMDDHTSTLIVWLIAISGRL